MNTEFDEIRPYNDDEIKQVVEELTGYAIPKLLEDKE